MITIGYKPSFLRRYNKLHPELKAFARERIEEFKDSVNHKKLNVHSLSGRMRGMYSFSVDYRYRIVFMYENKKKEATLIDIGDHDIYK